MVFSQRRPMANPKAAKWKTKPITNYEGLEELFWKDRATGEGEETAKEKLKRWAEGDVEMTINDVDYMVNENEISLENFGDSLEVDHTSQIGNTSSTAKTNKRKMKILNYSSVGDDRLAEIIEKAVDATNDGNEKVYQAITSTHAQVYSAQEVFKAVSELGYEQSLTAQYYMWLLEHKEKIEVFFGLPVEMRVNILEGWVMHS